VDFGTLQVHLIRIKMRGVPTASAVVEHHHFSGFVTYSKEGSAEALIQFKDMAVHQVPGISAEGLIP
jgi:hypothetical protein